MDVLRARRGNIKAYLTRLANFLDGLSKPTESSVEELTARDAKLDECWASYSQILDELMALADDPEEFVEDQYSVDFEKKYFACKSRLSSLIRTLGNEDRISNQSNRESGALPGLSNGQPSWPTDQLKLPPIKLKQFSGDSSEWMSFRDLYVSTVHENAKLTSCQKFHYLKTYLADDALNLLKHLTISDKNYKEAWEKLNSRYDRKDHIAKSFIKRFMSLPHLTSGTANSLRKLSDTADEVIRGLRALDSKAESRDPWLIHILLTKVDETTQQKWAELEKEQFPPLSVFLDFLESRCDMLESLHQPKTHSQKVVQARNFHVSSTNTSCPKCKLDHLLHQCENFKLLSIDDKRAFVRQEKLCYNCLRVGHTSNNCKSKHRCRICDKSHHTIVHAPSNPESGTTSLSTEQPISTLHSTPTSRSCTNTLLPTAIALVQDRHGNNQHCRILLDSGSQVSFVTESCIQRLQLSRTNARIPIKGLSSASAGVTRGQTTLLLRSIYNESSVEISAFVVNRISSSLPNFPINRIEFNQLEHLQWADPNFHVPGQIDILIGADKFLNIIQPEATCNLNGAISAMSTIFGWILSGQTNNILSPNSISSHLALEDIDLNLRRFWELEEASYTPSLKDEDFQAENHFVKTHSRSADGRYVVELPFKDQNVNPLGESLSKATNRMKAMEHRFHNNPSLKTNYVNFISEYLELGHMVSVPAAEVTKPTEQCFYLPHHAVFKQESTTTKTRVVFDGSSNTTSGVSLNDCLLIGPSIQRDLFSICLRFRKHRYVFSADIEKMYRQIWIAEHHQDYQRIVWRDDPRKPLQHYRLRTVTYGTSAAPYLAIRTLKQLATDYKNELPEAAAVIEEDFYVDDVLSGADTVEETIELCRQVILLLSKGGFNLRKWSSNCWSLLTSLPSEILECSPIDFETNSTKVLGLRWKHAPDQFMFSVSLPNYTKCSKRQILSDTSRIFDPLGFLTPTTIVLKVLFQELWLRNVDWDDEVPSDISTRFVDVRNQLSCLNNLRIARKILYSNDYEYHGFCDASEKAYSAVIYCRSVGTEETHVVLVAARTKVAPLKQVTIAKLELCAAVLLSRLFESLKLSLQINDAEFFAWTDSKIVLAWLSVQPRTLKTFMANRTSEILDTLPRSCWRHISSQMNPADCASRGLLPTALLDHSLWWDGPPWLKFDLATYLKQDIELSNTESGSVNKGKKQLITPETHAIISGHVSLDGHFLPTLLERISSWAKVIRIIAYCRRFIQYLRTSAHTKNALNTSELTEAKNICLRFVQVTTFPSEIRALSSGQEVSSKSSLIKLTPIIDSCQLLRVGGRLEHSNLPYGVKHPVILPRNHRITQLIVEHAHQKYLHVGSEQLFTILKQEFWIIGCRNLVKRVVFNCIPCFRQRKETSKQLMGQLPRERVTYSKPFSRVGCDYAGPLTLRLSRGRNPKFIKGYIALFVCFVTKAIHIELVSDLSTEAFLAALRRFIARRGKCTEIFSDNGTNFKGAHRVLTEMQKLVSSSQYNETITDALAIDEIAWHFIPPSTPHFGGLWESNIKAIKLHLKRVIGNQILTYEEMNTLLVQIEALLNSRPLFAVSDSEFEILTPAHFLIGQTYTSLPEPYIPETVNLRSNWKLLQQLLQSFWKQWHQSYITSLQSRQKWCHSSTNLLPGTIVVIKDDHAPPAKWALGIILECYPGIDGKTRVVNVKTKKGIFKRPITKLAILPIPDRPESIRGPEDVQDSF